MIGKIDFRAILKDHCRTLDDQNTGKISGPDVVLFFLLPILASALLVGFNLILGKNTGNVLITALAVFAGLLFNLLLLIFDVTNKPRPDSEKLNAFKLKYLKEIYSNIAYAILIALVTIVVVLLHFLFITLSFRAGFIFSAFSIYALTANFVLTLFMVLKRVHILLGAEFKS